MSRWFFVVVLLAGLWSHHVTVAQSPEPPERITIGVGPSMIQRHVPGRWAVLSVSVLNRTHQDSHETVAVMVGNRPQLQYARRLWAPAKSTRQGWLPIQIPDGIDQSQLQLDISTIHLGSGASGEEAFQTDVIGRPTDTRTLLLGHETSRCLASYKDPTPGNELEAEEDETRRQLVETGRRFTNQAAGDFGSVNWHDPFLPPSAVALDAVDQIVIASDKFEYDSASADRIRNWLYRGGQLWIMVDQVSPKSARALVGDLADYEVVDTVELNDITYRTPQPIASGGGFYELAWSSEVPAKMSRVITKADVNVWVGEWPAVFRQTYGAGTIYFTTVSANGLLDEDKSALLPYQTMAISFFSRRPEVQQPTTVLKALADETVGYEIPKRSAIGSVLGLHLLALVVAGAWLANRKQLQHLAIVVPVVSAIAALALISMGKSKTASIPAMVASSQIARPIPGSSKMNVHAVSAVYSPHQIPLELASEPNGIAILSDPLNAGEVVRLMFDDSGKAHWQFVTLPPGVVKHVQTDAILTQANPWRVEGTFNEQGFKGELSGLERAKCQDTILLSPWGPPLSITPDTESLNAFVGGTEAVMMRDQLVKTTMLSDSQRERQAMIRGLLEKNPTTFGDVPSLLAWTPALDIGLDLGDAFTRSGSALVAIPVDFARAKPNQPFVVPASLVRVKPQATEHGTTMLYNPRTGTWLEMNKPQAAGVLLEVPPGLLPCKLTRAEVVIKLRAPSRILTVQGLVDGQPMGTLLEQKNPVGVLRFSIEDPQVLDANQTGGIGLLLSVSASDGELEQAIQPATNERAASDPSRDTWQIEYIQADLAGTTQP
jgi:hypothetical protein